jgi:hypothetical protein
VEEPVAPAVPPWRLGPRPVDAPAVGSDVPVGDDQCRVVEVDQPARIDDHVDVGGGNGHRHPVTHRATGDEGRGATGEEFDGGQFATRGHRAAVALLSAGEEPLHPGRPIGTLPSHHRDIGSIDCQL